MGTVNVQGVDDKKRKKAIFILNCKGKTLSEEVRAMIDKYAEEFDTTIKNND